eukprot:CAMPEP_0194417762 /NCGR_PEP_ID=MMETSP0176-20130528/16828_1 /TAXON_ID=216777 /ORGANISM="Proboscia alata, Strain PI-D3" /LENGTH=394 /DNA_ID=CAMNT_0039223803 /DNA_START=31 /DNA_END=1216 /DNA_ORIENTATION=-
MTTTEIISKSKQTLFNQSQSSTESSRDTSSRRRRKSRSSQKSGKLIPVRRHDSDGSSQTIDPLQTMLEKEADDQFQEGWNYLMGDHHVMVNRILGQSLIVKAMHDQSVTAKGFCYFMGWGGLDMDMVSALRCFGEGASRGIVNALALQGYFRKNGYGCEQDFDDAFRLLKDASDKQHSWGMAMLAYCHQERDDFEKNMETVFLLYKRSAELGYAKAMFNLAELYSIGEGVERNKKLAIKWFHRAAMLDDTCVKRKLSDPKEENVPKVKKKSSSSRGRLSERVSGVFSTLNLSRSKSRDMAKSRDRASSVGRKPLQCAGISNDEDRNMKSRRTSSRASVDNDEEAKRGDQEAKVSPVLLAPQLLNELQATALLAKLARIVDLQEDQAIYQRKLAV